MAKVTGSIIRCARARARYPPGEYGLSLSLLIQAIDLTRITNLWRQLCTDVDTGKNTYTNKETRPLQVRRAGGGSEPLAAVDRSRLAFPD